MATFKCSDLGMKCGFEVKDENEDEMMKLIATHAEQTHDMKEVSPDMQAKIKQAIKK
jgi:predicted small metal-binding protein